jgi:hypothetical protein
MLNIIPDYHPVRRALERDEPFVYFHTQIVNEHILMRSVHDKTSIELDVFGLPPDGCSAVISHAPEFYEFRHITTPPSNIALWDAVNILKENADTFVVLDCKNIAAVPHVARIVSALGQHRTIIHAFCDELAFKPYPDGTEEPQWKSEQIPLDMLVDASFGDPRSSQRCPVHVTCRALSLERILDPQSDVLNRIITTCCGKASVVSLWLHSDEVPPPHYMDDLKQSGILTCVNIDVDDETVRIPKGGGALWCMTDHPDKATVFPTPSIPTPHCL